MAPIFGPGVGFGARDRLPRPFYRLRLGDAAASCPHLPRPSHFVIQHQFVQAWESAAAWESGGDSEVLRARFSPPFPERRIVPE